MIDGFRLLPDGTVIGLYTDAINLRRLGHVQAERASWVEWDEAAQAWVARLAATGERLGPFRTRVDAVSAERRALARRLAAGSFPAVLGQLRPTSCHQQEAPSGGLTSADAPPQPVDLDQPSRYTGVREIGL